MLTHESKKTLESLESLKSHKLEHKSAKKEVPPPTLLELPMYTLDRT